MVWALNKSPGAISGGAFNTGRFWYFIVYCGITMGRLWYIMVDYGIIMSTIVYYGISSCFVRKLFLVPQQGPQQGS